MNKRYRVVGTAKILGHAPGTTFEADLDEGAEAFFLKIGGLEVLDKKVKDEVRRLNIESHKRTK